MELTDLGLVGNCQFSALVSRWGDVVWCCLPRFDSEPVFGSLLDEARGGSFSIGPASGEAGVQRYLPNTNVLETTFAGEEGAFRVIDFAPRFFEHERTFHPTQLVRVIEPVAGAPRVRVRCAPILGWSRGEPRRTTGSHHVEFGGFAEPLRLTTDVPLSSLEGMPFTLVRRAHFVLAWGAPVEVSLPELCERLLSRTVRYWQSWVKHCNVPPLFQEDVIRSALVLKLHCYDDTGAIIAATTTSIPEFPGSGRTWDYRFCWLRDSFYVLAAFRRLGHFEERERFMLHLADVAASSPGTRLAPLHRVDGTSDLDERVLPHWPGFQGDGPVRVGNAAARHLQHDVYGEMVLAIAPVFLDERFRDDRSDELLDLLEALARRAVSVAGQPDAGIWEYREDWRPQTFSTLLCWAALDRWEKVARRFRPGVAAAARDQADAIAARLLGECWSSRLGAFASTHGGDRLDAAVLQMAGLRLLPAGDPRLRATVDAVAKHLAPDGWVFRYLEDDGFGTPRVPFTTCNFWLVEALAFTGRDAEAVALLERSRAALSPLGLLSEDYDPRTGRSSGNFPQAYSHAGLVNAVFAASPRWADVL